MEWNRFKNIINIKKFTPTRFLQSRVSKNPDKVKGAWVFSSRYAVKTKIKKIKLAIVIFIS